MHFKTSSAICFNLGQSKILSSGNELISKEVKCMEAQVRATLNPSEPHPSTGDTLEIYEYLSCRNDTTEMILKAVWNPNQTNS